MSRKSSQEKEFEIFSRNIGAINSILVKELNQINHQSYDPKMTFGSFLNTPKIYIHDSKKTMSAEHFKDYEFVFNAILRNLEMSQMASEARAEASQKRSDMKLGASNFLLINEKDQKLLSSCEVDAVGMCSKKVTKDFVKAKKVMSGGVGKFSLELRGTKIGLASKEFGFREMREYSVPLQEDPYYADDESEPLRKVDKVKNTGILANPRAEKVIKQTHSQEQVPQ